jgi:ABC-2 type transport system permease protein
MKQVILYLLYVRMVFRCQIQYRSSFLMTMAAQILVPFTVFAGMLLLFQRFGHLGGWSVAEVMLCFASIHVSFAVSECYARGFDNFSGIVSQGEFDRILVRPRSPVLQVLGARFEFSRMGRLTLAIIVLAIAIHSLDVSWNLLRIFALVMMISAGAAIFTGIFMISATLCFWTLQGLEVINIFTDGGREMAQYPLDIYIKEITRFFTFIIPFGLVNYLPLQYILDKPGNSPWQALLPLAAFLFLIPCVLLWRLGVRHYQSSGS